MKGTECNISLGRAVSLHNGTEDIRGPQFESGHRQLFLWTCLSITSRKDENARKRGREWPIKNK